MKTEIIKAENIHKSFGGQEVLHGVDVSIESSKLTIIRGTSGSGKTTLLNIMAGIVPPDTGKVFYKGGEDITAKNNQTLTEWRAQETGYAFQRASLLGGLTVIENVLTPREISGQEVDRSWLASLCARLGLTELVHRGADQLSGGQAQRVSLMRALSHKPSILFADEPTSSLDSQNTQQIHGLIRGVVDDLGTSVVMVSHDPRSEEYADNVIRISDGAVQRPTSGWGHELKAPDLHRETADPEIESADMEYFYTRTANNLEEQGE